MTRRMANSPSFALISSADQLILRIICPIDIFKEKGVVYFTRLLFCHHLFALVKSLKLPCIKNFGLIDVRRTRTVHNDNLSPNERRAVYPMRAELKLLII